MKALIDLDSGEFDGRSVLGLVDELVDKGVASTGAPNIGGSIVTAGGLMFIGATNDSRFRAFDKDSGKELWVSRLPANVRMRRWGQTWSKPMCCNLRLEDKRQ